MYFSMGKPHRWHEWSRYTYLFKSKHWPDVSTPLPFVATWFLVHWFKTLYTYCFLSLPLLWADLQPIFKFIILYNYSIFRWCSKLKNIYFKEWNYLTLINARNAWSHLMKIVCVCWGRNNDRIDRFNKLMAVTINYFYIAHGSLY